MLDFFKKNKYAKIGIIVLAVGLVAASILLTRPSSPDTSIPLSQVAAAVERGQVVKIEDSQEKGIVTIHYKDGTQKTARRDLNSSFLEQLKLLGVSENQLAQLHYEIAAPSSVTNEKMANVVGTLAMLGMMAFLATRMGGGSLAIIQKKYTEGDIPNLNFND